MTVLINSASADAESAGVAAAGAIIVSVVGTFKQGLVKVTGNIGTGEATVLTITPGDQTKIYRLEFATGVTFKAYLVGVDSGSSVTVEYIDV